MTRKYLWSSCSFPFRSYVFLVVSGLVSHVVQQIYPQENPTDASGDMDLIVASTNADVVVRVHAVNGLINILATNQNLIASDLVRQKVVIHSLFSLAEGFGFIQDSVHSALLARVQDTNTQVLDALYANPTLIIPVLSRNFNSFIEYLANSLYPPESKPPRAVLRTHFTFIASHFCSTVEPSVMGEIFFKIFFPFLMFSKPQHRTAEAVWEIISKSEKDGGLGKYELLGGCTNLWKETEDTNLVEKMSSFNLALASKIAGKLLYSSCSRFSAHTGQ
jgi:U3 small nucleolar RNA-associated protein 10